MVGRKNSGGNFILTSPSQILTIIFLTEKLVKKMLTEFLTAKIGQNKIVTNFSATIFGQNFVF